MKTKQPMILLLLSVVGFLPACNRKQPPTSAASSSAAATKELNNVANALMVDVLNDRDEFTPGFIPAMSVSKDQLFPPSEYEVPVSMLDFQTGQEPHKDPTVKIIYPDQGCKSWEECGLNDPEITYFLITPGDYTDWGTLSLTVSGTDAQRRIIRYYNPKTRAPYHPEHPVKMSGKTGLEVQMESINLDGASYWVFHGLTFRGKGFARKGYVGGFPLAFTYGSDHNILNFCLVEKVLGTIAVRIYSSSFNAVQNCVVREKLEGVGADQGGVGVSAQYQTESRGNRIVNNEIYNMSDGAGTVRNVNKKGILERSQIGETPGTIIENNDIYIETKLYVESDMGTLACAEDGLDIKQGTKSTAPEDRFRILNNRIWGFRPTDITCGGSGSTGSGIVIHRDASNLLIQGNVIFDVAQGIIVFAGNPRFPDEKVENIALINNLFYDIVNAVDGNPNSGLAMRFVTGVDVYYNTVVNARELLFLKEKKVENRFQCNTFINIEEANAWAGNQQSWSNLNAWYNYPDPSQIYAHGGNGNVIGDEVELADYEFYIKRWTGPEKKTLPNAVPSRKNPGLKIMPEQGCDCGPGGECDRWWSE